jgi:hypothetical protein
MPAVKWQQVRGCLSPVYGSWTRSITLVMMSNRNRDTMLLEAPLGNAMRGSFWANLLSSARLDLIHRVCCPVRGEMAWLPVYY